MNEKPIPSRASRAVRPLSVSIGHDPGDTNAACSGLGRHSVSSTPPAETTNTLAHTPPFRVASAAPARYTPSPNRSHHAPDTTIIAPHDLLAMNRCNAMFGSTK